MFVNIIVPIPCFVIAVVPLITDVIVLLTFVDEELRVNDPNEIDEPVRLI